MSNIKLPTGQKWLIDRMKKLGYRADVEGVCFGLATGGMQAALIGDIKRFYRRLQLIYSIPLKDFSKETIASRFNDSPEDQEIANEIIAFFDNVELHQHVYLYPDLFSDNAPKPKNQNIQASISLNPSHELKLQGGLELTQISLGAYDFDDLVEYFSCFAKMIESDKIHQPFTLFLNSIDHTISVHFNPEDNTWIIINGDELEMLNEAEHIDISDYEYLAEAIMNFTENEFAIFSTKIGVTKINEGVFRTMDEVLQNDVPWKKLHMITEKKSQFYDSNGMSLLCLAVKEGDLVTVKSLLEKGADINNYNKMPPLFIAAQFGHIEIAEYLLEMNADINACNSIGTSSLHIAIQKAQFDLVTLLLDHHANVNLSTPKTGFTPLHAACLSGHLNIVLKLLEKGADIHLARITGATPLFIAAQYGHADIVTALLSKGANSNTFTTDGWSPLIIAAKNGHQEVVVELLKQNNINIAQEIIMDIDYLLLQAKNNGTQGELTELLHLKKVTTRESVISINAAEIACIMGHMNIKNLIQHAVTALKPSIPDDAMSKKTALKRRETEDIYTGKTKRQKSSLFDSPSNEADFARDPAHLKNLNKSKQ